MNAFRDFVGTTSFLSSVTLPLAMMSFAIALLIGAFAPPNVSRAARAYYQSAVALVAFRVWYAATYDPGRIVWWGNLLWLNLLIATTMLAGAVILASSRGRARERRGIAEQDDLIGGASDQGTGDGQTDRSNGDGSGNGRNNRK